MTPRTLVVHNGARIFGGAERYLVRLSAKLQERGHRVVFLCRDEAVAARARGFDVPVEVAHLGGHVALHDALRFGGQLRRLRPDALLLGTFKKTWLGALGARRAGVPRVVARIGLSTDLPGRSAFYRIAFSRWIDRVVVNAEPLREQVLASLPSLPSDRVLVVHNGVEPPRLAQTPGMLRRELGIPDGAPVIGTVARLVAQKNLDLLLAATARLDGVRCVIAGDGDEREALVRRAADLGIAGRVHFLGHREAVGDVLAALDLFVVTSHTEGMSNAMLEALAAGVPVVSTPVSGAADALDRDGDARAPGVVVHPTTGSVADAVSALLSDRAELAAMAEAARRRARERFGWEKTVARWEEILGA